MRRMMLAEEVDGGGGRVDDTICSFIFFHFGRISEYGRPLTRPKGP